MFGLEDCFLLTYDCVIPNVGDRSYVQNSNGDPVCVIEVVDFSKVPFGKVDESFAKDEGYDSLAEWQSIHREFFKTPVIFSSATQLITS